MVCASIPRMSTVPAVSEGEEGRALIGPRGYLDRQHPLLELP